MGYRDVGELSKQDEGDSNLNLESSCMRCVQRLRFHGRGLGFNPWSGIKILYAAQHSQKENKLKPGCGGKRRMGQAEENEKSLSLSQGDIMGQCRAGGPGAVSGQEHLARGMAGTPGRPIRYLMDEPISLLPALWQGLLPLAHSATM